MSIRLNKESPSFFVWDIFSPFSDLLKAGVTLRGEFGNMRRDGNRRRLLKTLECEEARWRMLSQVHGSAILSATDVTDAPKPIQGDGLHTNIADLPLMVFIADCCPVLLFDCQNKAIALLHVGRRGVASRIVEKGIEHMQQRYHSNPGNLLVGIGPAIGCCCYEIPNSLGRETIAQGHLPNALLKLSSAEKILLDIPGAIYFQSIRGGVLQKNIEVAPHCTLCEKEKFYSYRSGDGDERMGAFAIILEG